MPELKKCPFCGKEVKAEFPDLSYVGSCKRWNISHFCDPGVGYVTCMIDIYDNTEEAVIERWNRRAGNE